MLTNFKKVSDGIYRSAQPVTNDDFDFIKSQNIRFIIDLENEKGEAQEESRFCEDSRIYFITVPLSAYTPPKENDIDNILTVVNDFKDQGVLVHCKHGQDRTGLIIGLYRNLYENVNKVAAWKEMINCGFHKALIGLTYYYWTRAK